MRDGKPVLIKLPEVELIDDKAGKPVGIQRFIGRRPIVAFGNSDGDCEMLQWTTAGERPRAWAASCTTPTPSASTPTTATSHIGRLDKALDEAEARLDRRRHEAGLEADLSLARLFIKRRGAWLMPEPPFSAYDPGCVKTPSLL